MAPRSLSTEYISKGQMRTQAPHGLQTDRLNAVSKGQMRPLALESAFSLGQNQAQQIQTQTHEPVPLSLAQDAREMHIQSDAVSEKEETGYLLQVPCLEAEKE